MKDYRDYVREMNLILNKIDGEYYLFARRNSLKENELCILYALDDGLPHSQKEICEGWLIPKTTVNTIVKELAREGYVTLSCEGKGKEKLIKFTEAGKSYGAPKLRQIYLAEEAAMARTIGEHSPEFIKALETFGTYLSEEFNKQVEDK